MSKIEQFFIEMEALFLKGDSDAFHDIKEDLLEHISIQLEEGLSEEEIIEKLGSPTELVEEFYEEQRLHTALTAETDVVALEDVRDVYLQERKEMVYGIYERIQRVLTLLLQVILVSLGVFSLCYLGLELVREDHIALIPIMIVVSVGYGLLLINRSKKDQYKDGMPKKMLLLTLLFIGLIIVTVGSIVSGQFFYQGKLLTQTIKLKKDGLQLVKFKSDFPVDLITMPTNESTIKIEIKGRGKSQAKEMLAQLKKQAKNELILDFGKRSIFDSFTNLDPLEVVLYIPVTFREADMQFDLKAAAVQSQNLAAKKIDVELTQGEFKLDNLRVADFSFHSETADLIMNHYEGAIEALSHSGKIVLKNGEGDVALKTVDGFVNLVNIEAQKAVLKSEDGKIVLTDTDIADLVINSQTNALVLEGQEGNTTISIAGGKLIASNNQGHLTIKNEAASIIVDQDTGLAGEIISQSGLVKWVQSPMAPITFKVSSNKGIIVNQVTSSKADEDTRTFVIKSQTGDISLYDKVVGD